MVLYISVNFLFKVVFNLDNSVCCKFVHEQMNYSTPLLDYLYIPFCQVFCEKKLILPLVF